MCLTPPFLKVALIACLSFVLSPLSLADTNSKAIHIILNNWTSQLVLSHITGALFEKMGYQVRYDRMNTDEQWGALAHDVAQVQVEVWEGTMAKDFNRLTKAGAIADMGTHDATTREEWWYPNYVEKQCPGLPDWQALRKCAAIFSQDGSRIGTYFAGPWEKPDEARIRALGLAFRVQKLEKGDDLWVELKKAYEQQRPIVLFNWTPNWVESVYQGKFVEFPAYSPECETNAEWGVNPDFLYDCGNPKDGWLKKAASNSLARDWPCAAKAFKNINFTNREIAQAAKMVDVDGLTPQQAAINWLNKNEQVWSQWIPQTCKQANP